MVKLILLYNSTLFAVSYQSINRRTKEIGIRKINGAGLTSILKMLNVQFFAWVLVSFIIACPVAWYAMHGWLENYAYKTQFSWWIFVLAGLIASCIVLMTVSYQSLKAATKNPVEALRYE